VVRRDRRLLVALVAASALLGGWLVARSGPAAALELFRSARYREAAATLAEDGSAGDAAAPLLTACLEPRPAAALAVLAEAIAAGGQSARSARVETAAIHYAQGDYRAVLRVLEPVTDDPTLAPGRALILAGQAARALGDVVGAERMFATVKPADPAFPAARTALGDLALADKDPVKALRYYDTAGDDKRVGAGRWQALRQTGRDDDADRLQRRLRESAPGSVAMLEINRVLGAEADERAARRAQGAAPDSAASAQPAPVPAGRYTLQLGAYSDRGLALELVRRYREELPDLRVDTVRDERGQLLYKVRSGAFVNPATARAEADRLQRRLGVDVFVAETGE
jgi:tetratricopeptide (TPR) repeat protein